MPKVKIENGVGLYYEIEGQGEAVVLIQGLDRDCYGMMAQRRALSSCYQVVAYDARGTGKSDTPQGPYTCTQMADDLYGLLKAIKIERAHLIGASLGGIVALECAIAYPEIVRSLILMCSFAKPDYFLQNLGRFWVRAIEKLGHALLCEEIMQWVYSREFFETKRQEIETARERLRAMEETYDIKGFQWKAEAGINADVSDRLDKVNVPTLVMAGELDHMAPPSLCERQLVKAINGSRLVIIKGAAHALFDEKPNEANREIMVFLSSVTK